VFSKRFARDEQGGTAVEFALVAPGLMIFIFGIFWVGWVCYGTYTVHHALAQSARVLQLDPSKTQADLQTYVRAKVEAVGGSSNVTVTLSLDPKVNGTQLAHTVATYPMTFSVPFMGTFTYSYTTSMTVPVAAS
jgi:Flp pilus assembly protein TadG